MQGHGCGVGYHLHPPMSAVCTFTQPRSSLQAGHIHVIKSLPEIWMMPLNTDTDTHTHAQIQTHMHTDTDLRMQTLINKDSMVRQNHKSDTQKDTGTDNNCAVSHLAGSHTCHQELPKC